MLANGTRLSNRLWQLGAKPTVRKQATNAAPKKVEVFIDDKKVLVDPGMTILQVCIYTILFFTLHFRLVRLSASIFHVFAIMIDCR
jgi:hypothetical protein